MRYTILFFLFTSSFVFAQKEAITSLSSVVFDNKILIHQKNKHTFSQTVNISVSEEIWSQFERVDAVFISFWTGSGEEGEKQYNLDLKNVNENYQAPSIIYFAQENPQLFSYPQKQTGFGTEIAFFEENADSLCLAKYLRKKIAPKGVWPCLINREFGTTAVNFKYRFPVTKQFYKIDKIPTFKVVFRTSSKSDTVQLDAKIVMTVQGKRKKSTGIQLDSFLTQAILNGMAADAFPLDHARWIIENKDVFLTGNCSLNAAVESGIQKYVDQYQNQGSSKIPNVYLQGLVQKEKTEKQEALAAILNRYIISYTEKSNMEENGLMKIQKLLALKCKACNIDKTTCSLCAYLVKE